MIEVPEGFASVQAELRGAAGRAFVAGLPGLAEGFLDRWGLRPDGPVMYGMCALVLPVRREDGGPAALKLQSVDEETVDEPVALREWGAAGAGAVGLLEHDPETGAMLLQRLDERRPLNGLADGREAARILAGVLARLVAVPAPEGMRRLSGVAARMLAAAPGVAAELAGEDERRLLLDCAAAVREVAGEPGDRLLHWDLHYDNILAGRAEEGRSGEWIALDPKPLAGDPGFELFPALDNRFEASEVLWRFDLLTEALGLDRGRAAAWTMGRVLQNAMWTTGEWTRRLSPDHAEIARLLRGRN
ncbi:hydroxyurea phosphotransferase [Streptomyces nitrosporeus]|uniref:Hydroxyurea phosphotransferase n=1 Tax=Streptomyces nitrosporeus TaxID=28894 RepID=A0A5J6FBJ7_9ACTN|nr:aminoglycoside phosphotransferase family protein [Streptomyces nitrosporeus]QEU73137.1 hydroxyurea phosphotransferase [Streptomyces nitrosporeus]GGZ10284.1 hydroxyurea phosphotransferase [Streptomyces nitrosporeus]